MHAKLTGAGGGGFAYVLITPWHTDAQIDQVKMDLESEGFVCWETKLAGDGVKYSRNWWLYRNNLALGSYFGLVVKIAYTVIIDPVTNFDVVLKFDLPIRLDLVFGPNLTALKVKFDLIGGLIWFRGQIWLCVKIGQENKFDLVV